MNICLMISMIFTFSNDSPDSASSELLQIELQKTLFGAQASEAQLIAVA
jgi:hypothetical protein